MDKLGRFLDRADRLLDRLERTLPKPPAHAPDWSVIHACRWQQRGGRGELCALHHLHHITLDDLVGIEQQKARVEQNTRQFVAGRPANNVLLSGSRDTGKSSLMKALLNKYAANGLRVIELGKDGLADIPDIVELVSVRPERFILYCDDLSFNADEPGYPALKAALDGSLTALSDNLLIYATSNRRHLMPEFMQDNLATKHVGDEINPGESVEEKISLSERFGLWVSFYPFSQEEYLAIVAHWLKHFGLSGALDEAARQEALQWAIQRGSRSGRVAWQFAKDLAGKL